MNLKNVCYVLLFGLVACKETASPSSENETSIKYTMEHSAALFLEDPALRSISTGVYSNNTTSIGYYTNETNKDLKLNDQTLFEIASVTKTFTGYMVAKAVLENKLAVEDDIRKYLKGIYPNLIYNGRPIKIKDLLTHTSGIRRDFSDVLNKMFSPEATEKDKKAIEDYTTANLFNDLKKFQLDTIPGSRYDYSPVVGPEILAFILQYVYQKPYQQLLQEFILDKAGMQNTYLQLPEQDKNRLIQGYTDEGEKADPALFTMTGAGHAIKSTIPDLTRYIQFLLNTSDPVVKEMQRLLYNDEEEGDQYGYFWHLDTPNFLHNGGTKGSTNWVILLPKKNTGFTVFFNTNGETSGKLINRIAGTIYDDLERLPKKDPYYILRTEAFKNPEAAIALYKKLKKEDAGDFYFKKGRALNKVGYQLLGKDKIKEAIEIFKYVVHEFPEEGNPYDSLGEAYFVNKQYELSLINYKKAFELNPKNTNAEKMIAHLKSVKN